MDKREATLLIEVLRSIDRSLKSIARDKAAETAMLVDERATIEQGPAAFQPGQTGRISTELDAAPRAAWPAGQPGRGVHAAVGRRRADADVQGRPR